MSPTGPLSEALPDLMLRAHGQVDALIDVAGAIQHLVPFVARSDDLRSEQGRGHPPHRGLYADLQDSSVAVTAVIPGGGDRLSPQRATEMIAKRMASLLN